MARKTSPFAAAMLSAAAISMVATPAAAAEIAIPQSASAVPTQALPHTAYDSAENHRYRRWRGHRHRGVDAGDVLAGILIIGGIAAIADAAKKSERKRYRERYPYPERDERYRERDYRDDDRRYDDRRSEARGYSSGGLDRAVDMCVDAVERDVRVSAIDEVDRTVDGWRVAGQLEPAGKFSCTIGNDGEVQSLDVDRLGMEGSSDVEYPGARDWDGEDERPVWTGAASTGSAEGAQWSDDAYAEARRTQGYASPTGDDGRYSVYEVEDFEQGGS